MTIKMISFTFFASISSSRCAHRIESVEMAMDIEQVVRISKALADPARLRIYQAIAAKKEVFCGELVERQRLTPGTVSHHLKILADAQLIECRREGQFVYNRATPETMKRYTEALTKLGPWR
ncbi:MAG: transcriptional regulator [Acidobacteria bacterium]|nr:MAG: transcriptional regulator [Acidobacteriota bacterium]